MMIADLRGVYVARGLDQQLLRIHMLLMTGDILLHIVLLRMMFDLMFFHE